MSSSALALDTTEYPRLYRPASPAAGQGITIVVPGHVHWEILALSFALVTNATVVNRLVRLLIGDGTSSYIFIDSPFAQTASQSLSWFFQREVAANFEVAALNSKTQSLPRLLLEPGWQLEIQVGSMQGTDQLSAVSLSVLERFVHASEAPLPTLADPTVAMLALGG